MAAKSWLITTGLTLTGALTFVGARAQENASDAARGGGVEVTVDVNTALRFSDNYENLRDARGNSTFVRTDLNFGVLSETRAQRFQFDLGGRLDAGDFAGRDGFDSTLESRHAILAYQHETRGTLFEFDASHRRNTVRDSDISDDFDLRDTIADSGDLETNQLQFGFETGRAGPVGLEFDARLRDRDYSDVENDDLFDSESLDLDLQARFDVSPTLSLSPFVGLRWYDAENTQETERDRTNLGVAIDQQISPSLTFDGRFSYDRIETTKTVDGDRDTTTTQGPSARLGLTLDRPNGTVGARYSTRVGADSRRDTFWLDRNLELPNGAFGISLGVTDSGDTDPRALAALSYRRALKTGMLSTSLSQTADAANADSGEVLRTQFEVNYDHEINTTSSLRARIDFANIDGLSDDANDSERLRLNLTYRRDLTADWDLTTGVEHTHSAQENNGGRTTNSVFMGLERSFSFRP